MNQVKEGRIGTEATHTHTHISDLLLKIEQIIKCRCRLKMANDNHFYICLMLSTFFDVFIFSPKLNDDDDDDEHGGGSDVGSGMATGFQKKIRTGAKMNS